MNLGFFIFLWRLFLQINVTSLQLDDGKMVAANKYGQSSEEQQELELTDHNLKIKDSIKVWIILRQQ